MCNFNCWKFSIWKKKTVLLIYIYSFLEDGANLGMIGYITTPIKDPTQLCEKINNLLEKVRTSAVIYNTIMSVDYSLGNVYIIYILEYN